MTERTCFERELNSLQLATSAAGSLSRSGAGEAIGVGGAGRELEASADTPRLMQRANSAEQQYALVLAQLQMELALRFTDPNDPGLYKRRKRLRTLFGRVPSSYATVLYSRLGRRATADPLSKSFHRALARPTRRELLGILSRIPSPRSPSPTSPSRAVPVEPPLVWPTSPLPTSESSRFRAALAKLEERVNASNEPRKWRYNCWIEKLKRTDVDDRVIKWGLVCPSTSGAVGAAMLVGACDIGVGRRPKQDEIEKRIRTVADVDAFGESLGIMTYVKADIVVSEERTSLALENLRVLHDDVNRAIDKLRIWSEGTPFGGASAMPLAYRAIKDWISQRQGDPKSPYSCM